MVAADYSTITPQRSHELYKFDKSLFDLAIRRRQSSRQDSAPIDFWRI